MLDDHVNVQPISSVQKSVHDAIDANFIYFFIFLGNQRRTREISSRF